MGTYRGTVRCFRNIPTTVIPSGLGTTIAQDSHGRPIVGSSFTTFTRCCNYIICPTHIHRPGSGTLMRGTMGLLCHSVCLSVRKVAFSDLRRLGATVRVSLLSFGRGIVTKQRVSHGRVFLRKRGSCLHPLPIGHCMVGREGLVAIKGGSCISLFGRRCDIPGRCMNEHVAVLCSTSAIRVCYKVGLITARSHYSVPCACS